MTEITALGAQGAAAARPARDPGLEKAARAFEAIFVRQMIGAMRSASLDEGMFDSGATEQFRSLSDAKTAENMAQTGALGIAELLMRQLAPVIDAQQKMAAAIGGSGTAALADGARENDK